MQKRFINIVKPILNLTARKKKYQNLYYYIYKLGLYGMNYNAGNEVEESGEKFVLNYIKNKIGQKDYILFDVGANIGNYSKMLFNVFGNNSNIYTFEPSITTFAELKHNLNHTSANLINMGLSDKVEKIKLFIDPNYSRVASVYNRQMENLIVTDFQEVSMTNIDTFCSENKIEVIDFLKIDVEGHEYKTLVGANNYLQNGKIKFIQFEFGGCNIDSKVFFRDFWNLLKPNYKIYRVVADGIFEICKYEEILEIFTYSNFFAELKNPS